MIEGRSATDAGDLFDDIFFGIIDMDDIQVARASERQVLTQPFMSSTERHRGTDSVRAVHKVEASSSGHGRRAVIGI